MQRNEDGSVTLAKSELEQLNKAYQALYKIVGGGVSYIGDYAAFRASEDLMNVYKWLCLLNNEEFNPEDYE